VQKIKSNILVIRLSAMGDCAMVVPVLLRLINTYAQLKITVVTKIFFIPIFKTLPQERISIVAADTKHEHKGFFGVLKLGKQLKKLGFDQVADLHDVLRSKIIRAQFSLAGIPSAVIDKGRKEKKALTRFTNKTFKPLKTTPERYVKVFEELGYKIDLNQPARLKKPEISTKIISLIGNSNQDWIGIAPFAAHRSKTYPLDLMEKLIAQLDKTHRFKILLFGGGKREIELMDKLSSQYENVISVAGKLDFEDEIISIANLDLMISMDSGNGHLAAMFNVPVITIWGATHPFAGFAPFGQPQENQILPDLEKYPQLPTSVFGDKEVSGYEDVMRSISPEIVLKRIEEIVNL